MRKEHHIHIHNTIHRCCVHSDDKKIEGELGELLEADTAIEENLERILSNQGHERHKLNRILHLLAGEKPPLTLWGYIQVGGNTVGAQDMDLTVHVGKEQAIQLAAKDVSGDAFDFTKGAESNVSGDESIATVRSNTSDASQIAVAGVAAGTDTVTCTFTNNDGNSAQLVINVTVLENDATELDGSAIGTEVDAGTSFGGQ